MGSKYLDRRKHTRYAVNAIAFSHNIAGRVINISEGGMAIKFFDCSRSLPDEWETDFICRNTTSLIKGLPVKLLCDQDIKLSSFTHPEQQEVRIKFCNLGATQQEQIREYISGLSE